MAVKKVIEDTKSEEKRLEPQLVRTKKGCMFCDKKTEPSYVDSATLKRFMSDRARIHPKQKTSICSKHQRRVTKEIKHARHLGLLPFVATI